MAGNLVFQDTAALAAATPISVLNGHPCERPPFNAFVQIAVNGSAAGLRLNASVGGVQDIEDMAINALNRFPVLPDDIIVLNGLCPAGMLNRVRVNNPTAGALTWFVYVCCSIDRRFA